MPLPRDEEGRFVERTIDDTELHTWSERDRAHVELRWKDTGATIVEWWDQEVEEAVTDGFLNPGDYHHSAWEYYKTVINPSKEGILQ